MRLIVQGMERVRLLDWIGTEPYLVAPVEVAPDRNIRTVERTEVAALRRAVTDIFRRLVGDVGTKPPPGPRALARASGSGPGTRAVSGQ